jgi:hypothetical protein
MALVPAKAFHKQKSRDQTKTHVSTFGRKSPEPTCHEQTSVTNHNANPLEVVDARSDLLITITKTKQAVFHGIGMATINKRSHYACRTGSQRTVQPTSIRNLRHLNNFRKVARRERSPDRTRIKLRALAEWAESAPEDNNVQLPPLAALSTSINEDRMQASTNASRYAADTPMGTHPAAGPPRDSLPSERPNDAFHGSWSTTWTSEKDMTTRNRVDIYKGQEK